jgi:hypothetical protein
MKYFLHTPQGSLTCLAFLGYGADGSTSPPKKVVLRNFIAPKNPSFSAEFDPVNLGSNGKHDNQYNTGGKKI